MEIQIKLKKRKKIYPPLQIMFKKIFLALALLTTLQAQCTDNCLRCVENVCYYCDLSQGFRLIEGQCKPFQLENCYLFDDLGACLLCNKDFQLDSATQTCIKIMQEDIVPNCSVYDSSTTCIYCLAGFYLNNGKCEQIVNPITNCDIENSQQVCLKCKNQFLLSIDQKSCLPNPKTEGCQSYKNIQCETCKTGFMEHPNFYLSQVFSLVSNQQKSDFLKRQKDVLLGAIDLSGPNNCVQNKVTNCAQFYTFDFCDTCVEGFLRTEKGLCTKQPVDLIQGCVKYDSLLSCQECAENHWLSDNQTCLPVRPIPFCKAYSKKLKESQCVECQKTHYLIGYDKCVQRTVEITNCLRMNSLEETCLQCNNTFVLTDDRLHCLPQVTNCQKYQVSNYLSSQLYCLQCKTGFYLKKQVNFCNQGDVANCLVYENNSNQCQICQNKFFLNNGFCEAHDVIPNCQVYHPKLKNVCSDCNYESFLFDKSTHCQKAQEVTNCAVYLDEKTCAQCLDKYFLNAENKCELIPASENCVQRIGSQCYQCLSDFVLEKGICRDPLDYIQNECASHNVDGVTDYQRQQCFFCGESRIPINYRDNHLCIEHDIMLYRQKKTSLDPHCLIYFNDQNEVYTCIRCKFPKVLNEGQCVDTCPTNKTLYKQLLSNFNKDADRQNESFSVESVNVCGEKLSNCSVAAPNLNQPHQSKVTYSCVLCQEGTIPSIEFNQNSVLVESPFEEEKQFGLSPVSFRPSLNCVTVAQLNILGEINLATNQIDNCDFYTNLGLTTGCTKCLHGYSGVVLDVVNQCEIYVNNKFTCSKCKHGYYKASIYECKPVITVEQCLFYSQTSNTTKCIECNASYYVQSDTKCAQRQHSLQVNCTPNKLSDTCACIANYFNVNTTGGFKCELKPLNCLTPLNQNSCNICDQTKSFKNTITQNGVVINVCQAGGLTDCIKYKTDQQVCLECNETAFLNAGICTPHISLSTCTKRSGTLKNTCQTCMAGSVLFDFKSKCLQIKKITNCLKYDSIQTCEICAVGYRLDNLRFRCIQIPVDSNCITQVPKNIYDATQQPAGFIDILDARDQTDFIYDCTLCRPGFFKVEESVVFNTTKQVMINSVTQDHPKKGQTFTINVCKSYQNTFIGDAECQFHSVNGSTQFSSKAYCESCKTNFFPEFIQDNRYICMDKNYLQSKSGNRDLSNCRKVTFDGTTYSCQLCNKDFFYNTVSNLCVQTCPDNYKIQKLDITVVATLSNISFHANHLQCVNDNTTVPNCSIYSSAFDTNVDVCVSCKNGFVPIYTAGGDRGHFTNFNTFANKLETENPFAQYRKITACQDPMSFTARAGQVGADQTISNCQKYMASDTDVVYCIQCKLGYSGQIKQGVFNMFTIQYIDSCGQILHCNMNSNLNKADNLMGRYYNNWSIDKIDNGYHIEETVSCFACDGNRTPVLFALNDYTSNPIKFYEPYGLVNSVTALNAVPDVNKTGHSMACIQLYNSDASVPTSASTGFLTQLDVANPSKTLFGNQKGCALGWAKTDGLQNIENMKCIACKPGYAPSNTPAAGALTVWPTVTSCLTIENCQDTEITGLWLNACVNCVHFHDYWTHIGNENKGHIVDFSKCVKERENISKLNCFAAYHTGPCQICQKGYVKNLEGICVALTATYCSNYNIYTNAINKTSSGIVYNTNVDQNVINRFSLQIYLLYLEFQKGCTQCQTDYITTLISSTNIDNSYYPYICSANPHNPLMPVSGTSDIANCTNYGLSDPKLTTGYPLLANQTPALMTCKKCNTNYVLTKDGKCTPQCHVDYWIGNTCTGGATFNLLNCKIANEYNGTTCMECEALFLNVAGVCVTFNQNTPIKNCNKYDSQGSLLIPYALCTECLDGFYLSADKKLCLTIPLDNCAKWENDVSRGKVWCTKCKQKFALIEKKNQEQFCFPLTFPLTLDKTTEDNQNECEEWDMNLFQQRQLKCNKCKLGADDYFPITESGEILIKTQCLTFASSNVDCSSFDVTHNQAMTHPDQVTFPLAVFGTFYTNTFNCQSCVQDSGVDTFKTYWYDQANFKCKLRQQVTNCLKHFQFKNECQICKDNFHLQENVCIPLLVQESEEPINKGYIQKCQKMSECDGKVSYQGLHPHVQSLVSCHQCNQSGRIPFIGVNIKNGNFISLQEYGIPSPTGKFFHQQEKQKAVECLEPLANTFGVSTSMWSFPQNCGVGIVDTNQQASTANYGVFCGACKTGFKATIQNTNANKYKISACDSISNCESSQWFNNCSQCLPYHSYQYVANQGVKYDVCIPFTANPNCYVVEQINEGTSIVLRCQFCRKGYILNPDGYCENILAPRCAQFHFNFRINYEIYDLPTGLIIQGGGFGCQMCDTGFIGLYNPRDEVACTASPYHTDGMVTPSSNYIHKCKNYKVTQRGELECQTCQEDSVLTIRGKCVSLLEVPNCELALDSSKCRKCRAGYVEVDRICVSSAIQNCQTYANNDQSFYQICLKCQNGYFLEDNKCVAGVVNNCEEFDQQRVCTRCKPQFSLVYTKNLTNYCYPISQSLDCAEVDQISFSEGEIRCNKCKSNEFFLNWNKDTFEQSNSCQRFLPEDNCIKYDQERLFFASTYFCIECDPLFFVDQNSRCVKRNLLLEECAKYSPNGDKCEICKSGFFVSSTGKECISYPMGIPKCANYLQESICLSCQKGFFLQKNACVPVQESQAITNCDFYLDNGVCSKCATGYIWTHGSCNKVKALNCATYENIHACATCLPGFGLQTSEDTHYLDCIQQTKANCLVFEEWTPFRCITCDQNYYVDTTPEANCVAVITLIQHCEKYQAEGVCLKCAQGTALQADGKACLLNVNITTIADPNCRYSKLPQKPICQACDWGMVFRYGHCKACKKNTFEEGCMNCDPNDQNRCLLCRSGFYMNNKQVCVKNGSKNNDPTVPAGGNNGGSNGGNVNPKFEFINKVVIMTFLLLSSF